MSGSPSLPGASVEQNVVGPDYFGFYTQELVELLSQDDESLGLLPQGPAFSSKEVLGVGDINNSLTNNNDHLVKDICQIRRTENSFSESIGANLPDFKKERLRSLVRESLCTFAQEVDEKLHSILGVSRMRSNLEDKKEIISLQSTENISGHDYHPEKKQKVSSSTSVNELQYFVDMDCTVVEKYVKMCSDELFDTIVAMEQKLEEFIDIVITTFRPMTVLEKHKLRQLIQDLPERNLDRVADIITRNKPKPVNKYSRDEIRVDLENENKVTLWRLYYYVKAVENAMKLCEA